MARTDLEQLVYQMSADIRGLERQNARALANVGKTADKIEKRYKDIGKVDLGKFLDQTFDRTRLAAFDAGTARIPIFGQALEALGPIGFAAAAGVAAAAVAATQARQAMAFADEIDDMAQKLNISTDALQEYRFAMTEVGGESKDADEALASFNKTLGAAQSGLSPKAMKPFAALGFTREQLQSYDSGEEALVEVARRVADLSKESERAAVAEKLGLGPMLPLLREGSARMEDLRQRARDLGIVMDEDLVKKGADANQQFETMSEVIKVQMSSAFVGLSDEVVGFTGSVADALEMLNSFIERYDQWKARAQFTGDAPDQTEQNLSKWPGPAGGVAAFARNRVRAGIDWLTGRRPSDEAVDRALEMQRQAHQPLPGEPPSENGDSRLTPTARSGGGRQRDTTEQRERRQEQFDRELERVQTQLIRAYDHEFESIRSDTGNKLAQLQQAHEIALADIVRRENEYVRTNGLRGLAAAEGAQLREAEDLLYATAQDRALYDERLALETYRLQQEEEASRLTLDMLGLQRDRALTERERHEVALAMLAEENRQAREQDRAALARDPELDDEQRQAELNRRDAVRTATYDQQRSQPAGSAVADLISDIRAPEDQLDALREMYAEIDRLRQKDRISEEEAARAKAEVDVRYQEARLQNTRSMLDNLSVLQNSSSKELAAIGKAAAIAQATIDGYLAVQKALAAFPPPLNFAMAAAVGAATAANVAAIAGVGFERGGYTGNGGRKQVAGVVHGQEYVFDAAATRRIGVANLDALSNGSAMLGGMRAAAGQMTGRGAAGDTFHFAPVIDARGADRAGIRDLRRELRAQAAGFEDNYRAAHDKRVRFETGTRRRR